MQYVKPDSFHKTEKVNDGLTTPCILTEYGIRNANIIGIATQRRFLLIYSFLMCVLLCNKS